MRCCLESSPLYITYILSNLQVDSNDQDLINHSVSFKFSILLVTCPFQMLSQRFVPQYYSISLICLLITTIALCRPVAQWSKNWIIGRWIALVSLVFFLLVVDIQSFHLLRKYNPEDTVYGLFIMGLGNLVGFSFLGTQAQELVQDAKSAYNVPSWCYGLASSTAH